MDEFDKCRFCLANHGHLYGCEDDLCYDHHHYRIDVHKIIAKSKELGISVTDVLNLIKECNE